MDHYIAIKNQLTTRTYDSMKRKCNTTLSGKVARWYSGVYIVRFGNKTKPRTHI